MADTSPNILTGYNHIMGEIDESQWRDGNI